MKIFIHINFKIIKMHNRLIIIIKKMKKTILLTSFIFCTISTQICAQSATKNKSKKTLGPNDFSELINANIPGASKLGKPQLVMGETMPAMGEGMGWAAPAVYDWNGDGKKDLLIGEFGSGLENEGMAVGNFVRVYENEGTDEAPKFSDVYSYARGDMDVKGATGTPLSIFTWCCLAFTPRFADLNGDGFEDLLTGQYNPGYITWFRGGENGFLPGIKLEEVYDTQFVKAVNNSYYSLPATNPESLNYWQYSSVAFGDFDDDGDQDMVIGGPAIRLSKNIGTKFEPLFEKRELLLDINGDPLKIREIQEDVANTLYNPASKNFPNYHFPPEAGSSQTVPYVVDWDNDGILDILVTDYYTSKGGAAVTFFKGVKTKAGLRFEPGIPLFSTKNGEKEFPGSYLNVCVTDWNNDGVNDLIIGANIATLDRKFNHELSWKWESETGIGKKNPAHTSASFKRMVDNEEKSYQESRIKLGLSKAEMEKKHGKSPYENNFGKEEYQTLAHQGYVYVMLGEKRD
jgi:hypothetical protein